MKILKRYKDEGVGWELTTLEDCLQKTEEAGYWKIGTVVEMLLQGNIVQSPFAEYKLGEDK